MLYYYNIELAGTIMALHDHVHSHETSLPTGMPALGSRLLAMSAGRRMGFAAVILLGLWACVGWAVSYDPSARTAQTAEPRK